jgi:glutamate-1-semialdehyde 2,1-aminomutase
MNIHFYMGDINAPEDLAGADRELLRLLHLELLNSGFHIASRGLVALSLPLTKTDLDAFVSTIERFVDDHKDLGNSR